MHFQSRKDWPIPPVGSQHRRSGPPAQMRSLSVPQRSPRAPRRKGGGMPTRDALMAQWGTGRRRNDRATAAEQMRDDQVAMVWQNQLNATSDSSTLARAF